ncbi:transposase, IS5 family [Consotaella salsifontis]|uniref:Transposase, IS5 family n=1 Tax=Consotaella salsifontis TaxID=1365950 RepID=A0A1T4SEE3_9HYPH|nr:transposase, IS5 family [Consotaella salsifontis]
MAASSCAPFAGTIGDAANAVLAAVGYNFRRILAWLRLFVAFINDALFTLVTQAESVQAA